MTGEEYLIRYQLLRHALERDKRNQKLLASKAYLSFAERFTSSGHPLLSHWASLAETERSAAAKRERLYERYALRIARAIDLIGKKEIREYARYHYLFGLTKEEIADASYYSLRTVYRHGTAAKKEMERCLLQVSPHLRRIPHARFHIKGGLKKKQKRLEKERRSMAALTAKRRPTYCW